MANEPIAFKPRKKPAPGCQITIFDGQAVAQFNADLDWMMVSPRLRPKKKNDFPFGLCDITITRSDGGVYRYVPPFPDHWSRWQRLKFLFARRP